jgi:hypothetical protein
MASPDPQSRPCLRNGIGEMVRSNLPEDSNGSRRNPCSPELGTTAEQVVREATVPVLSVPVQAASLHEDAKEAVQA